MPRGNAAQFIVQRHRKLIQYRLISAAEPFQELRYQRVHSTRLFFFAHRWHYNTGSTCLKGSMNQLVRHLFDELAALTRGGREKIFTQTLGPSRFSIRRPDIGLPGALPAPRKRF